MAIAKGGSWYMVIAKGGRYMGFRLYPRVGRCMAIAKGGNVYGYSQGWKLVYGYSQGW
jgi:hypothetical protein